MTKSFYDPVGGGYLAFYRDRSNQWRIATDARGFAIRCETAELAVSVASYRRRRIEPLA